MPGDIAITGSTVYENLDPPMGEYAVPEEEPMSVPRHRARESAEEYKGFSKGQDIRLTNLFDMDDLDILDTEELREHKLQRGDVGTIEFIDPRDTYQFHCVFVRLDESGNNITCALRAVELEHNMPEGDPQWEV